MATTTAPSALPVRERTAALPRTAGLPWYIWCAALAVTSATIGAQWDISWHSSIGRDTFWTPAHMAIYLCGVLAGLAFGFIILTTTFAKNAPLAPASVHIWGFRAPLGAFIASWGGIAMLTSAPFDNWWHDAYGLDVKIISPPHILLFIGTYGVILGTLVLVAGHMNRTTGLASRRARFLFLYVAAILLTLIMVMLMEYTDRVFLHTVRPYIIMAALAPIVLTVGSRATAFKWAATAIAGFYTLENIALILILPLFPAEPKLGPVYQHVTHFIPAQFPILLIVPAFALDLILHRTRSWNAWKSSALAGFVFTALLVAAEWPFAQFLMSPAARNRFFGTLYFVYDLPPTSFGARHLFFPSGSAAALWLGLAIAVLVAILAVRWGISRGEWLERIKR